MSMARIPATILKDHGAHLFISIDKQTSQKRIDIRATKTTYMSQQNAALQCETTTAYASLGRWDMVRVSPSIANPIRP